MGTFTAGAIGIDFDILDLSPLAAAPVSGATPTSLALAIGGVTTQIFGSGFVFGTAGPPDAGTIERIIAGADAGTIYDITGIAVPAAAFRAWVLAGDSVSAKVAIFAGSDAITGSSFDDRLRGYAGADSVAGGAGDDFLDAGDGDDLVLAGIGADTVVDPGGANYLRGEGGDDHVVGGAGFDDINGNQGADTADGGPGDDWVVGGKDNDLLYGETGGDLVYGNLGDDVLFGGGGADTMRGGQGNDSLTGGTGDDFVSGDRGEDTMTGGAGADIFHTSNEAGTDRVLDFSQADGDRVMLDPGTTFSIAVVGGDTVITVTGGQVILIGVTSLSDGDIFGA